jgi:hypothetical protein
MKTKTFEVDDILGVNTSRVVYKITLKDIKRVLSLDDDIDIELKESIYKEFKFSNDGVTFSYWNELTNEKLKALDLNDSSVIKVRYNFNPIDADIENINITKLILKYEETPDSNVIHIKTKETSNIEYNTPKFNVYQRSDIAHDIQQKLSKSVNEFIGIDAIYFKSDVVSTDTFLHEHTLLELSDKCGKRIKVVFEDQMPDRPMVTPFGTTFEVPVNIHIDFVYFQEQFGKHLPSHGDIVFIPMSKAIWEVNGSDIIRGIMNKPVYWNVHLNKYNPKANRFEDNLNDGNILDTLRNEGYNVISSEETFKESFEKETEKVIKPRETRPDGINDKKIKEQRGSVTINPQIKVVKEELENNFIVVSHCNYDVSRVALADDALVYPLEYSTKDNISFSAWLKLKDVNSLDKMLVKIENNRVISSKFSPNSLKTGYTLQKKENNAPLMEVIINDGIIEEHIENGLYYILDKQNAVIFNEWTIINNRYIQNNKYDIRLDLNKSNIELKPNIWYNILLTESARFNQVRVFIYQLEPNRENLNLVYDSENIQRDINEIVINNVKVGTGLSNITNIRLFDDMLQLDDHHIVLNQQLVNDSHKALILDNSKLTLRREEYGKPL